MEVDSADSKDGLGEKTDKRMKRGVFALKDGWRRIIIG